MPPIRARSRRSCTRRSLTSPIGALLRPAAHAPVLVGLLIAFAELAVGLGTLVGLFGRLAAVGGMVLSLILFLSVSYNTTPYFYGPDIVFLFAWTPLVIARLGSLVVGRGPCEASTGRTVLPPGATERRWLLELERRAALRKLDLGRRPRQLRGRRRRDLGRSREDVRHRRQGARPRPPLSCRPRPSRGERHPHDHCRGCGGHRDRPRERRARSASARAFTDPAQGVPAYVVRPSEDSFVAFSAVCTHAGCTVGFYQPDAPVPLPVPRLDLLRRHRGGDPGPGDVVAARHPDQGIRRQAARGRLKELPSGNWQTC